MVFTSSVIPTKSCFRCTKGIGHLVCMCVCVLLYLPLNSSPSCPVINCFWKSPSDLKQLAVQHRRNPLGVCFKITGLEPWFFETLPQCIEKQMLHQLHFHKLDSNTASLGVSLNSSFFSCLLICHHRCLSWAISQSVEKETSIHGINIKIIRREIYNQCCLC